MGKDRIQTNTQMVGYLFIGITLYNLLQHIDFPFGQAFPFLRLRSYRIIRRKPMLQLVYHLFQWLFC